MNTAPTPCEFAQQLAERYGPRPDPANPFFKPAKIVVRRLVLQAVSGEQNTGIRCDRATLRGRDLLGPNGWKGEGNLGRVGHGGGGNFCPVIGIV